MVLVVPSSGDGSGEQGKNLVQGDKNGEVVLDEKRKKAITAEREEGKRKGKDYKVMGRAPAAF